MSIDESVGRMIEAMRQPYPDETLRLVIHPSDLGALQCMSTFAPMRTVRHDDGWALVGVVMGSEVWTWGQCPPAAMYVYAPEDWPGPRASE